MKQGLLLSLCCLNLITANLNAEEDLSKALDILNDDNKYQSITNYGVVSAGFEQIKVNLLQDDISVEKGVATKLDIHLYGYSLYAKTISNYSDFTLITPTWNSMFYDWRGLVKYKSLKYKGIDNGKMDFYTAELITYVFQINNYGQPMKTKINLPKISFVKLNSDNKSLQAEYYSIGMGGSIDIIEQKLLSKLSLGRRLPYDYHISLMEGAGIGFEYLKGKGNNLNYLLEVEDGKDSVMGYMYTFNPSIFFTFPIGYVKVSYLYNASPYYNSATSSGFNSSLAIVF
jgi:hypothetical protein